MSSYLFVPVINKHNQQQLKVDKEFVLACSSRGIGSIMVGKHSNSQRKHSAEVGSCQVTHMKEHKEQVWRQGCQFPGPTLMLYFPRKALPIKIS